VERLQNGDCGIAGGIALVDLVTSFERLASHCANISLHIIKRVENDSNFDEMHGHANDNFSEEYKALYYYYESQYLAPILADNMAAATTENTTVQPKSEDKKNSDKHDHVKEHIKKKAEKKEIAKKDTGKKDTEKKDVEKKDIPKKEAEKKAPPKKSSDKKPDSKKNEKKK
jgi:phosphate:Na+ symporter